MSCTNVLKDENNSNSPPKLPTPINVTASDGDFTDIVSIAWDSVNGAEKYYVYRSTSEYGYYSNIGDTALTTFDDENAESNDKYYYKVGAWSSDLGYSDYSAYDKGNSSKRRLSYIFGYYWKPGFLEEGETEWYYFEAQKDKWYGISWNDYDSYVYPDQNDCDIVVSVFREDQTIAYCLKEEYPEGFRSNDTEEVYIKVESDEYSSHKTGFFDIYAVERENENNDFITQAGGFSYPHGVAIGSNGSGVEFVYVADTYNDRIRWFTLNGLNKGDLRFLNYPFSVTGSSGDDIFIAETGNNLILKSRYWLLSIEESWGGTGGVYGQFNSPEGIATTSNGLYVYVADTNNHRIQKFDSYGNFLLSWGSYGSGEGQFKFPSGVGVTGTLDSCVIVADTENHRIQMFEKDGTFVKSWGNRGFANGQFFYPRGISTDLIMDIYVADTGNNRIQKFDLSGHFINSWGNYGAGEKEFFNHCGITIDSNGNVYIADTYNNRVQKFTK